MLKRSLVGLVVAACAALGAQGQSKTVQPTLTPQDSGRINGLTAVSPVNPQVVWASGRAGTFVVTTDGGNTWKAGVVPGAGRSQPVARAWRRRAGSTPGSRLARRRSRGSWPRGTAAAPGARMTLRW